MAKKTISNTFTVNTIEDGTSPYLLNLTNEMESIACDDQGTPYLMNGQRQTASTNFNFFVGNSRVRPTRVTVEHNGQRLTSGVMMDGFLATWTTSGITIEFYQSYQTEGGTVTVKYDGTPLKFDIIGVFPPQSDGVSVMAAATFAVVPAKGTALYRIIPSTDQIVKHADNSYTPTGDTNITCSVTKTVGGVVSTPDPSEYTLKMIKDGGSEVGYQATQVDTITSKMEYILYVPAGGTRIMDKETIPLVLDGKNASTLDIDNEYDSVQTDSTGKILADKTIQTIVRLYKGSAEIDISGATITVTGMPASTIATFAQSAEDNDGKGRKLSWAFIANQTMSDKYNIAITYTYSGTEYKATFTINASKGQAVFNLKPSHSALPCTRNASTGALNNPPALSLQVEVTDTNKPIVLSSFDNNGAVTYNNTKYYIRYSTSSMPTAGNAGDAWPHENSVQASTTDNNIYIALFTTNTSSGTLLDRETVPLVKDGEDGEDAHEVNPNILLRTIFDKTLDFVKEKWTASTQYWGNQIFLDPNADTVVQGRKSIRIDASLNSTYIDLDQDVYGKLKTNTWYTLSFNSFSGASFNTFIYSGSTSATIDTSKMIVDGVEYTNVGSDGNRQFQQAWDGARHTVTFKTASSFPTQHIYIKFRAQSGTILAICMPKLEEGEVGTTYIPNESDLDGKDAATVVVTPSQILFNAKSNGNASGTQYFTLNYGLYVNNVACEVASADKVTLSLPTNVNLNGNKGKYSSQIYITDNTAVSTGAIIQISIEGTLSGKTYNASTSIPVAGVRAGADGSRGKIGRAYYYAGEWNELANNFQFIVNDTQAPFFGYQPSGSTHGYYVFNPETNGTYVKSSVVSTYGNPSANNAPWSKMNDDQEYIITKAIFGDYAQFGGAIINKDWLTSVYGDICIGNRMQTVSSTTSGTGGYWVGKFWGRVSGTYTLAVKCITNGNTVYIGLYDQTSGNWPRSQTGISGDAEVTYNVSITSGHEYVLLAYKGSGTSPIIEYAKMDTGSNKNYLYLDPNTTSGDNDVLYSGEQALSTSYIYPITGINLYEQTSYKFFFFLKNNGSNKTVTIRIEKFDGENWNLYNNYKESYTVSSSWYMCYTSNWKGIGHTGKYRIGLSSNSSFAYLSSIRISAGAAFSPAFGVDLFKGMSRMNNAIVRGTINTQLFYASTKKVTESDETYSVRDGVYYYYYNVNLETEPYYMYYVPDRGVNHVLYLPDPSNYEGVELRFFWPILSGSNHGFVAVSCSGGIYRLVNGEMKKTTGSTDWLPLKPNKFATFKSMDASWWSMDDNLDSGASNAPSIDPDEPEIDEQV